MRCGAHPARTAAAAAAAAAHAILPTPARPTIEPMLLALVTRRLFFADVDCCSVIVVRSFGRSVGDRRGEGGRAPSEGQFDENCEEG